MLSYYSSPSAHSACIQARYQQQYCVSIRLQCAHSVHCLPLSLPFSRAASIHTASRDSTAQANLPVHGYSTQSGCPSSANTGSSAAFGRANRTWADRRAVVSIVSHTVLGRANKTWADRSAASSVSHTLRPWQSQQEMGRPISSTQHRLPYKLWQSPAGKGRMRTMQTGRSSFPCKPSWQSQPGMCKQSTQEAMPHRS